MADAIEALREQLLGEPESKDAGEAEQLRLYLEDLRQSKPSVTVDEEREHARQFFMAQDVCRYPLIEQNPIQWGSGPDVDYDPSDIGRIVQDLDTYQGTTMAPYKITREIFGTRESLMALEAYHALKVCESYILINRKYGNIVGKMHPPRQLCPLQPPYCHIPEKYRDKMQIPWKEFEHGGQYYGMKMISYDLLPTGNVNNLTVQSVLAEIAELEEEIEMDQLQGSPRWLNFCGRAPDYSRDDVVPRTDRLVLSPAVRSLIPMFRDFFTTDQACEHAIATAFVHVSVDIAQPLSICILTLSGRKEKLWSSPPTQSTTSSTTNSSTIRSCRQCERSSTLASETTRTSRTC